MKSSSSLGTWNDIFVGKSLCILKWGEKGRCILVGCLLCQDRDEEKRDLWE